MSLVTGVPILLGGLLVLGLIIGGIVLLSSRN